MKKHFFIAISLSQAEQIRTNARTGLADDYRNRSLEDSIAAIVDMKREFAFNSKNQDRLWHQKKS
jgi:hypothetical protein